MDKVPLEFKTSSKCEAEKAYIIGVFCKDFLKVDYEIEFDDLVKGYEIIRGDVSLRLPDFFFDDHYCNEDEEEPKINTFDTGLLSPQLSKLPAFFFQSKNDDAFKKYTIPVDVFGMAFFLMTGYADMLFSEKDIHHRFVGHTSFLCKNNLIDRPVIQEWFTVIAVKLYGEKGIKNENILPKFNKHISHDVDQPFEYLDYTFARLLKRVLGDILVRHSFLTALKRIKLYTKVKSGDYNSDPYNNFDELLRLLKEQDVSSTFFFVTGANHPKYDVLYDINHEAIKEIVKKVAASGHKVGIHPSYTTLNNGKLLKKETEKLQAICTEIGISQKWMTSRKHYLRWDWKTTPKDLYLAGIEDDYTLGYADRSGFRAGVAFAYGAFDWETKIRIELRIHPLIIMECSLLDKGYMNLDVKGAEKRIIHYHNQLKGLGGEFVILWHNHRLLDTEELKLFKKSILL